MVALVNLPADLPESWVSGQTIAPTGAEVGLSEQHGYNYQSKQINAAQRGVNALNARKADLDDKGQLLQKQVPDIDCGGFDDDVTVEIHDGMAYTHAEIIVDGNGEGDADTSGTLEEHMTNPMAHPNLVIDGNGT